MKQTFPNVTLRCISNGLLVIASVSAVCVILELVLMLILPDPIIWIDPQESYVNHPTLAYKLKPDQEAYTHSVPVRTNSLGLRDHEIELQPDSNTFRILCLGDSLTFGNGVRSEDTYPKQLEQQLNGSLQGRRFEVINAGVPGYDTWQEAQYLLEYGLQLKANLVIIGFYANDIVPRPDVIRPAVGESGVIMKQGWLGLAPQEIIHILKRSRLFLLLRDRYDKLTLQLHGSREYDHQAALLAGVSIPSTQRGWKEVEASFDLISKAASRHNFGLLVVIFPLPDQVIQNYENATYPSKVEEIANKYGIPTINLLPEFTRNFRGFESLFIAWDGHPNEQAYSIAASEIKKYLTHRGLVAE